MHLRRPENFFQDLHVAMQFGLHLHLHVADVWRIVSEGSRFDEVSYDIVLFDSSYKTS